MTVGADRRGIRFAHYALCTQGVRSSRPFSLLHICVFRSRLGLKATIVPALQPFRKWGYHNLEFMHSYTEVSSCRKLYICPCSLQPFSISQMLNGSFLHEIWFYLTIIDASSAICKELCAGNSLLVNRLELLQSSCPTECSRFTPLQTNSSELQCLYLLDNNRIK